MPILDNIEPIELLNIVQKWGYRGVFLGGCIERKEGSNIRPSAHCHCAKNDKYKGWICFKSKKTERVIKQNGKSTLLFLHELAHLGAMFISPSSNGYGKSFKKALYSINGRRLKYDHKF